MPIWDQVYTMAIGGLVAGLTAGALLVGGASNALAQVADVATGQVLASGGVGAAPTYTANPSVTTLTTAGKIQGNVSAFGDPAAAGTTASAGDKIVLYETGSARCAVGMGSGGAYFQHTGGANVGLQFYTGTTTAIRYGLWSTDGSFQVGTTAPAASVPAFWAKNNFSRFDARLAVSVSSFGDPAAAGTTASAGDKIVAFETASARCGMGMGSDGTYLQSTGGAASGGITFWTGTTTAVEVCRMTTNANLIVGGSLQGTSAAKNLILNNGATAPSTFADMAQLYCIDISAGNATLGILTERPAQAGVVVQTGYLELYVNVAGTPTLKKFLYAD